MNFEQGKLYTCTNHNLLIHESEAHARNHARTVLYSADKLKCKVQTCHLNTPFIVLDSNGEYIRILFGESVGWIIAKSWITFEQI
jgi:hypothetical protein